MKKIYLILIVLIACFAITFSHAQLANTRWKSKLNINGPVNTIFDFKKDTASLYTVADSTIIETMSYTSDGTTFTVLKIDGESDCDNNTRGKYSFKIQNGALYLKMITDNCEDRSGAIDTTKWTRWKDVVEVKVDEAILKQYVGVYQTASGHPITISFENGKLYAEALENQLPKSVLIPESPAIFFLKIAGAELEFIKDAGGKVTKIISHEEKDYELKKLK